MTDEDSLQVRKRISFSEYLRLTAGLQVKRGKQKAKEDRENAGRI